VFTYQENRVLFLEKGQIAFPASVTAVVELSPNPALGDQVAGKTVRVGSRARISWDANVGRSIVVGEPPLPPTDITAAVANIRFVMRGRTVEATWDCSSRSELLGVLGALHFVLPLAVSLELADPLTPFVTSGKVGGVEFAWMVEGTGAQFETVEPEIRDERCLRALKRLPLLCDSSNARLLAAAAYVQRAARLLAVGVGPSEFAGEAVINLAKALEVLFPAPLTRTREAVRKGLKKFGYDQEAIEHVFVPALILRSSLDAAHVRMATLAANERRQLQLYMESVEPEFRRLVVKIADAVSEGTAVLAPYDSKRSPEDDLAKTFAALARSTDVAGPSDPPPGNV
jgi:hypothetical protein